MEEQKQSGEQPKFRPFLAVIICAISACFFTTMSLLTKVIYKMYPTCGVYSILIFRCLGATLILTPYTFNKHWKEREKHNLLLSWTSLNQLKWGIAIGHIIIVSILVQVCLRVFPITLVTIFLNCGPILTVFLCAALLSSEKLTNSIVIKVVVAFIGVLFITFGAPETETSDAATQLPGQDALSQGETEVNEKVEARWYHYITLVAMPLAIALGNTMMGEVRNLDPILIPFYLNLIITVIGIFVCSFGENGFFPSEHDLSVHPKWIFLLLTLICQGISSLLAWSLKVLAYKYDRVSRVSPVFYLESAFALILDLILFDATFTGLQIIGLALVIGVFAFIIISAYLSKDESEVGEAKDGAAEESNEGIGGDEKLLVGAT